ncbi:hypothetical protein ACLHTX_29940 [Pseudomonas aeruginosa]|uniref:hypothetical protein n=1 Tax=Pseudomonas aeruginosa TaxID=287 RepID=UPI00398321F5
MSQNAGKCLSHAELCRHTFGSLRQLSLCCFAAFYFVAPIWLLMPKGLKVGIGENLAQPAALHRVFLRFVGKRELDSGHFSFTGY